MFIRNTTILGIERGEEMINKDVIEKLIAMKKCGGLNNEYIQALNIAIKSLEESPNNGTWINNKTFRVNKGLRYFGNCSECGYLQIDIMWGNYCPNCGAKMIRGDNNEETSKIENTETAEE